MKPHAMLFVGDVYVLHVEVKKKRLLYTSSFKFHICLPVSSLFSALSHSLAHTVT